MGFVAVVVACTGMEVAPWTVPGGTYGSDEPTTSTNATEPIDGSHASSPKAETDAESEEEVDADKAVDATTPPGDAAPKDAGVG